MYEQQTSNQLHLDTYNIVGSSDANHMSHLNMWPHHELKITYNVKTVNKTRKSKRQ